MSIQAALLIEIETITTQVKTMDRALRYGYVLESERSAFESAMKNKEKIVAELKALRNLIRKHGTEGILLYLLKAREELYNARKINYDN